MTNTLLELLNRLVRALQRLLRPEPDPPPGPRPGQLVTDALALLDRAELYFVASRQQAASDLRVDEEIGVDAADRAYLEGVRAGREAVGLLERARILGGDVPHVDFAFVEPEVVELQHHLIRGLEERQPAMADFFGRVAAVDAIEQVRRVRSVLKAYGRVSIQ